MFKNSSSSPVPPEELINGLVLEERSIVKSNYEGSVLTGVVIKRMEDMDYLVYFDSLPDIVQLKREHLRVRLYWTGFEWVQVKEPSNSIYTPGTLIEVSFNIGQGTISWVPAMIIKEIKKIGEKKVMVRLCNKTFRCIYGAKSKITVDFNRIRVPPPLLSVEKYNLQDCVEMFYGSGWRSGIVVSVTGDPSEKLYKVELKGRKQSLNAKHMDLRILDLRIFQETASNVETKKPMCSSSGAPKATIKLERRSLNLEEAGEILTLAAPREVGKKWKREEEKGILCLTETTMTCNDFGADVKETPLAKALLSIAEDFRPWITKGMKADFNELSEEVKSLNVDVSSSEISRLMTSFSKFEKYGVNVAQQQSRISQVLSIQARRANKLEEKRSLEEKISADETEKHKVEEEMIELKRQEMIARERKEAVDKRIIEKKSCLETMDQEIEELELEFHTTVSAPW